MNTRGDVHEQKSIQKKWRQFVTQAFLKILYGNIGKKTIIYAPLEVQGADRIYIGEDSVIEESVQLKVMHDPQKGKFASLNIGNRVTIGVGVKIICHGEITIRDDVKIDNFCVINDAPNEKNRVEENQGYQAPIRIGTNCQIGKNVKIIANGRIGKGCVVAPNSIVNAGFPDYVIISGSPARVVSQFDTRGQRTEN